MHIQTGTILQSTAALNHSIFENSLILITAYNSNGAAGFIINRLFNKPLNALQEFSHVRHFNLYNGGPVDMEHLFFVHCRPDVIEGAEKICEGIFFGGNFKQAVTAINNYTLTKDYIKIFIGYCGWDAGELEAEIEEGSWKIVEEEGVDSIWR